MNGPATYRTCLDPDPSGVDYDHSSYERSTDDRSDQYDDRPDEYEPTCGGTGTIVECCRPATSSSVDTRQYTRPSRLVRERPCPGCAECEMVERLMEEIEEWGDEGWGVADDEGMAWMD